MMTQRAVLLLSLSFAALLPSGCNGHSRAEDGPEAAASEASESVPLCDCAEEAAAEDPDYARPPIVRPVMPDSWVDFGMEIGGRRMSFYSPRDQNSEFVGEDAQMIRMSSTVDEPPHVHRLEIRGAGPVTVKVVSFEHLPFEQMRREYFFERELLWDQRGLHAEWEDEGRFHRVVLNPEWRFLCHFSANAGDRRGQEAAMTICASVSVETR